MDAKVHLITGIAEYKEDFEKLERDSKHIVKETLGIRRTKSTMYNRSWI